FGILLAAGLLTIVPLLPRPRGGKFAGSVQGMLLGAPLGVCVNCAAPIGQAMLKGGSRVEVALAAMFASPSFNVIVLGMLLTLFPWYLAALTVATSLVMVLIVVPQLSRQADLPGWRKPVETRARVILLVAAFGTLLPIPIAFDVVVCAVLWNAGVPMSVVATLLVTLGIYSVYPWSLIGTTLSWRIATLAGIAVVLLGVAAGSTA